MPKLIITYEIDIDKLREHCQSWLHQVQHLLLKAWNFALHRSLPQRTRRRKKAVYTAKNADLDAQIYEKSIQTEQAGEGLIQCANPSCGQYFEYQKRGNQIKKYCSTKCKDDVHNQKKKASTHLED